MCDSQDDWKQTRLKVKRKRWIEHFSTLPALAKRKKEIGLSLSFSIIILVISSYILALHLTNANPENPRASVCSLVNECTCLFYFTRLLGEQDLNKRYECSDWLRKKVGQYNSHTKFYDALTHAEKNECVASIDAQGDQETVFQCLDDRKRQQNQFPLGESCLFYFAQIRLPVCTEMGNRKE